MTSNFFFSKNHDWYQKTLILNQMKKLQKSFSFCTVCFLFHCLFVLYVFLFPCLFVLYVFLFPYLFVLSVFFIPLPFCTVCFFIPLTFWSVCFLFPCLFVLYVFYSPASLYCMFFIPLPLCTVCFLFPCLFVLYAFLFPGLLYCMFFSPLSFVGLPLCILLSNWYFRLWFWSNYSSFPNEKSFHSSRQGSGSLFRIRTLIRTKTCLLILQKKYEKTSSKVNLFSILWFYFSQKKNLTVWAAQDSLKWYKNWNFLLKIWHSVPQDLDPETNFLENARSGSGIRIRLKQIWIRNPGLRTIWLSDF